MLTSAQRERLLGETAIRIRQSVNTQLVLETAVLETRQLLEADRVLVYQFRPDMSGQIVAESVAVGWNATLGQQIQDTCFQQGAGARYRQGRQWATGNIYQARLTDCHLQLLEQFQVKANLVVPIIVADRLWGLLIVHQCADFREWQPEEQALIDHLAVHLAISIQQAELYQQVQAELQARQQSEAFLWQERKFISAILDVVDALVVVLDRTGRIERFNQTWQQVLGYTAEAIQGRSFCSFLQPSEATDCIKTSFAQQGVEPFPHPCETTCLTQGGDPRLIAWSSTTLLNQAGAVEYIVATGRDITEQRKAEQALQQSECWFRALLEHSSDMLTVARADGTRSFVSPSVEWLLGYPPEVLLNSSVFDFVHPDDLARIQAAFAQSVQYPGELVRVECRFCHRRGHWVYLDCVGKNLLDDPIVQGVVISVRDITDRRRTEAELLRSEARNRAIRDALPDLVIRMTRGGKFLDFKPAKDFFSIQPTDLQDAYLHDVMPPDVVAERLYYTERALQTGETQIYEFQVPIQGQIRWEEARIAVSGVDEVLVILRDITDRKQAEIALKSLVESTASVTGKDFFPALAQPLMLALNVRYVMITKLVGDDLHTLSFWSEGHPQPDISFSLADAPCCKTAITQGRFYCSRQLRQEFAEYPLIQSLEAESYLGIALTSTSGQALGNLCILDDKPMEDIQWIEAFLRVFAARAAAELERQQATEALEQLNQVLESKIEQRTAALRDSEAKLSAIFNQAAIGINLTTLAGRYLKVNQKLCDILGYSQEELLTKTWAEVSHPDDVNQGWEERQQLYNGEVDSFAIEKRYLRKDGRIVWVNVTISLIRKATGEPDYSIAAVEDISDRKRAEVLQQQQVEQERLFAAITQRIRQSLDLDTILNTTVAETQQLLQADRVLVYRLFEDGTGQVIAEAITPGWQKMLNTKFSTEAFPHKCHDRYLQGRIYSLYDRDQGSLPTCMVQFMQNFQIRAKLVVPIVQQNLLWGLLITHQCTEPREWQPWEMQLLQQLANQLAIAIHQSELYGRLQTELNERKQAERQLQAANDQLLIANAELARATQLKNEFLANMSHELRTPLNAVLGISEGLLEEVYGSLNERQKKAIATVGQSGHHLLELINDILDLAKIEADKLELQIGPVSVQNLCDSSLTFVRPMAQKKQIHLTAKFPEKLGELQADDRRLRQVLINLLSNAVKFTPVGGQVTLEVQTDPLQSAICFSVKDTGIGIAPENLGKLFQPFTQIDSSLSREYSGTGLGLALVRRITEMHGGSIAVSSQLGEGSEFSILLPQPNLAEVNPSILKSEVPTNINTTSDTAIHSKALPSLSVCAPLILLTEDNPANIDTISNYLQAYDYRLIIANNGLEAVEIAKTQRPQLILMDIQTPKMNGLEATRRIRADPRLTKTPIIALTALAMPGDRDRCLEAGADEYLIKPVSLKRLLTHIQQLLDQT